MTIRMNDRSFELVLNNIPKENAESMARAFIEADSANDINFKEIIKTEAKCMFHLQVYLYALQMDILPKAAMLLKKIFFDNENSFSNELYNKLVGCFFEVAPDAYKSNFHNKIKDDPNEFNLIFDNILQLFATLLQQINTQLNEKTFIAGLNSILKILNTGGVTLDCIDSYCNLFDQYFFKKPIPISEAKAILDNYRETLNKTGKRQIRELQESGNSVPPPNFRCTAKHWNQITKSAVEEMFRFQIGNSKIIIPVFTQIRRLSEKFDKENGSQQLYELMIFDAIYKKIHSKIFTKKSQFIKDYLIDPFLTILNSDGFIDVFITVIPDDIDLRHFLCNLCNFIGYGIFEPGSKWTQIFITFIKWLLEFNNDSSTNFQAFINSATVLAARKPDIIRSLSSSIIQASTADPIEGSAWVNTLYSILAVAPTENMWDITYKLFNSSTMEVPIPKKELYIYNILNRLILLIFAPPTKPSIRFYVNILYQFFAKLVENESCIPEWFDGVNNPASKLPLTMCFIPQICDYTSCMYLKDIFVGLYLVATRSATALITACLVTVENFEFLSEQKILAWFVKLFSERSKEDTAVGKLAYYTSLILRNGMSAGPCDMKDSNPSIYGISKSGNIISIYDEGNYLLFVTRSPTGISAVRVSQRKPMEKSISEENLKPTIIRKAALHLDEPLGPFKEYTDNEQSFEKSKSLKLLIDNDVHGIRPLPPTTDFSAFDILCVPSDIEISLVRYSSEGFSTERLEWLKALMSGCPETRLSRISLVDGIMPGRTRFVVAVADRSVNTLCHPQELQGLASIVVVPTRENLVRVLPLSSSLTGDSTERLMQPSAAARFIAYHAYINDSCVRRGGSQSTGCLLADAFVERCEQRKKILDDLIESSSVKGKINAASYVLANK